MKLSNYLSGVLSKFKDNRVVENVMELVQNIIEHKEGGYQVMPRIRQAI